MAVQGFTTSNALTVKQWSEGLEAEVLKKISYTGFIGKRSDSLCQWKDELATKPGDTVTIGLRMQLDSAPKTSTDTVENNEQTLTMYNMSITLDEVVDAVRFKNIIDRQRVTFDMRDEARAGLADQLANAWDTSFFTQAAGASYVTEPTFYGHNSILEPQGISGQAHWTSAKSAAVADEAVAADSTAVLTLSGIDKLIERAKTLTPAIRPANIPGFSQPMYVLFVHPYQMTAFRNVASTTGSAVVNLAAMQGGKIDDNPLISGNAITYNGVLIVESNRVPQGVNSSTGVEVDNCRRAIFCGAQSLMMGWGRLGGDPRRFRWVEKHFDYDREYGISSGFLGGIKLAQFNGKPFGSIIHTTYAVAAT
jgi:N4-gp56 family major capsid protein